MESKILVLLIIIFGFFFSREAVRYQITGCGQDRAVLVDRYSGEVWITDTYTTSTGIHGHETIFFLKPVGYCDKQKDNYTYKPDEKRNNKNTTFEEWLKRKWHWQKDKPL